MISPDKIKPGMKIQVKSVQELEEIYDKNFDLLTAGDAVFLKHTSNKCFEIRDVVNGRIYVTGFSLNYFTEDEIKSANLLKIGEGMFKI